MVICSITKREEECGGHCEHCIVSGTEFSTMYDGASKFKAWEEPEEEEEE